MRRISCSAFLIGSLIYLSSCQKDSSDTPANNGITGNYKFGSLTASTVSTAIVSDGITVDKTVTYSDYITKNNKGTLVIDDKNITTKDLSYSIDTTVRVYFYEDGSLIDSEVSDFQFDVPASSATSGYNRVTNDSIYVTSGSMFFNGTAATTDPVGVRYKMEGDKLHIYASKTQTRQEIQNGYLVTQELKASVDVMYQKQ